MRQERGKKMPGDSDPDSESLSFSSPPCYAVAFAAPEDVRITEKLVLRMCTGCCKD